MTIKRIHVLLAILFILIALSFFVGCEMPKENKSADTIQRAQTEQSLREAVSQVGMPAIKNFQELKQAKMIFELRDREKFICHAYLFNEREGKIGQYLGKCLGYGLPYSVQFTNPEKVIVRKGHQSISAVTIPQADPNGLYMPQGLSATWLTLLDEDGTPHVTYIEPQIIVSPVKLHKD